MSTIIYKHCIHGGEGCVVAVVVDDDVAVSSISGMVALSYAS